MSVDSILFLVKTSISNFFKNIRLSLASISVLSICLVVFGVSLVLVQNVNLFIENLGAQNQVVVYLDEDLEEQGIVDYKAALDKIDNVSSIVYKPKEIAMEEYKQSFGEEYADITADLDASILRDSFIIEMRDFDKFDQTLYEIEKIEGSANIVQKRDVIDQIQNIRDIISFFSGWVIVFLLGISFFIITNTVKTVIFARRNEIMIMKYCGASDGFIRFPYLLEGLLIGIISGCIGYFALNYIYSFVLYPIFTDIGFFTPLLFTEGFAYMIWIFIAVGAIIGSLGTVFPLRKYLEV